MGKFLFFKIMGPIMVAILATPEPCEAARQRSRTNLRKGVVLSADVNDVNDIIVANPPGHGFQRLQGPHSLGQQDQAFVVSGGYKVSDGILDGSFGGVTHSPNGIRYGYDHEGPHHAKSLSSLSHVHPQGFQEHTRLGYGKSFSGSPQITSNHLGSPGAFSPGSSYSYQNSHGISHGVTLAHPFDQGPLTNTPSSPFHHQSTPSYFESRPYHFAPESPHHLPTPTRPYSLHNHHRRPIQHSNIAYGHGHSYHRGTFPGYQHRHVGHAPSRVVSSGYVPPPPPIVLKHPGSSYSPHHRPYHPGHRPSPYFG